MSVMKFHSLSLARNDLASEGLFSELVAKLDVGQKILRITAFGLPVQDEKACLKILKDAEIDCPVSWFLDTGAPGGLQVQYVSGASVEAIRIDNRTVGFYCEDDLAKYCFLSALSAEHTLSRSEQTLAIYQQMRDALQQVGMDFDNIIRTWFYLEDILDWYDEFNEVRSGVFSQHGIFAKSVPVSTGIGAANSLASAALVDLVALVPKEGCIYKEVISPLQCSALDYGSSFSRALEIATEESRQLLISGTASIAPEGETIHLGDCEKQIEETLKVVEAIVLSRQMDWSDVTRSIVYFRHASDCALYEKVRQHLALPAMPMIQTALTVCRDDLLFEIELDLEKS